APGSEEAPDQDDCAAHRQRIGIANTKRLDARNRASRDLRKARPRLRNHPSPQDLEECRRKLDIVTKKFPSPSFSAARFQKRGSWAKFELFVADGVEGGFDTVKAQQDRKSVV